MKKLSLLTILVLSLGLLAGCVVISPNENAGTQMAEARSTPEPARGTVSQRNAVRAAENYIRIIAFSRSGLIAQLEFEGYSNADAIHGVDNISVDWYEQAARKAQSYLDIMPFSRSGLIDQLLFDGFTREQAEFGVGEAGL